MKIKLSKCWIISFSALFFCLNIVYAHGTKYKLLTEKIVGIQALTENNEPLAMAKVLITDPDGIVKDSGLLTNEKGIYYFHSKRKGKWKVNIRDNFGHGLVIIINVDESLNISKIINQGASDQWSKIFMAICVIWGFTGFALFFYNWTKKKIN